MMGMCCKALCDVGGQLGVAGTTCKQLQVRELPSTFCTDTELQWMVVTSA